MAQQVVIAGAMFNDVPAISVPDSNNVYHSFTDVSDTTAAAADVASGKYLYTSAGVRTEGTSSGGGGGDSWSWMGKNPTKVKNLVNKKVYLKDSAWANWTPTTTTTTLINQENLSSETINTSDYDYTALLLFHSHFEYGSGATQTALVNDFYSNCACCVYGYPTNLTGITNDRISSSTSKVSDVRKGLFYKNTSGGDAFTVSQSYGLYVSTWGGVYSVTESAATFVTPNIVARCGNSYFTTANASAVDQDNSYYEMRIELWTSDRGTSILGAEVKSVRDMWLNGF